MQGQQIAELVDVIRSKNAGPFRVTLDIFFNDRQAYNRAKNTGAVSREVVAQVYGIALSDVCNYVAFDPVCAVKITLRRKTSSGSFEDTDVYGAQQHAPLFAIKVPEQP